MPKQSSNSSKRSHKPLAIKKLVVTKYLAGEKKTNIARDTKIHPTTVDNILNEAEIAQHIQRVRSEFVTDGTLDKAKGNVTKDVFDGGLQSSHIVLRGVGVYRSEAPQVAVNVAVVSAERWKQIKNDT